jgi:hypothetical protein
VVLRPGACLSVPLVVTIRRKVVTVPASPVMAGPNGDYVCVVGDGNKVTRVDVQQAARRICVIATGSAGSITAPSSP